MKERLRAAAIIVENHKLLLVKGNYKEYWTPGGKVEEGEPELDALRRELHEELSVDLVSAKYFGEYSAISPYNNDETVISRVYIASISGKIKPEREIKGFVWMSRKDFAENKYPLVATTRNKIIPDLIKAGHF